MDEFQIGDLVRIIGPSDRHSDVVDMIGFNSAMDALIGTEDEIVAITQTARSPVLTLYTLSKHQWNYVQEWLEPVNAQPNFTDEDFENVFK